MAKSKSKVDISAKKGDATATEKSGGGGGGRGLDEIESLFAGKRRSAKEMHEARTSRGRGVEDRTRETETREDGEGGGGGGWHCAAVATSASTTGTSTAARGRRRRGQRPAHLHERATKMRSLTYTREDVERLNGGDVDDDATTTKKNINNSNNNNNHRGGEARDRWASDGLGGVFNGEGYTGRRDDGGRRVFKAHLMNRRGFGTSPDCPFDCDCCFI
ncbi:hypothetical protein ACHAW5_002587 [Stephanodiscus triporus]|uniref:Uncharacterized protein n=1 Tax=Stephanodiscus triporus TaxID=2934178 RepID=A0ABD3MH82_9STRA